MGLPGIPNASPIPGRYRLFKPASGTAVSAGNIRPVCLIANKIAVGTEQVEKLGGPIVSLSDCVARFGQKSEMVKGYKAYVAVDPSPIIYGVAVAEGGGASASTVSFNFAGANATRVTSVNIDSCDGRLQTGVGVGDTGPTIAANALATINGNPDAPFSAVLDTTATVIASGSNNQILPQGTINVGSTTGFSATGGCFVIGTINALVYYTGLTSATFTGCTTTSTATMLTGQTVTNAGQLNITTAQKGPRSAYWINQLRLSFDDPTNATTVVKGTVVPGAVSDNVTNALAQVDSKQFTYLVPACTSTSSVSASDGGLGQIFSYLASIIAPLGNKSSMVVCAVDGTSTQATAVTQSATVNHVFGHCYRVKNNDWHPFMVACHHAAVHRFAETTYAAANLAGWTNDSTKSQVYQVPPPFNAADAPTTTDMTTDLNGGVSTVGFHTDGTPYIVRSITTYSWTGSSSTADYRAREGHIPSVMIQFWDDLKSLMTAQNQPNVADDPPSGGKPVAGFMYPRSIKSMANTLILAMTRAYQDNKALLDPSVLKQMLTATSCTLEAGGFDLGLFIASVRHNLFDFVTISEISPAY